MPSSISHRWNRWLALGFVGTSIGVALGSLFFIAEFEEYSSVGSPVSILVFIPIFGLLLYFWTRTVEEVLALSSVTIAVGGTVTSIAYLTPLFVQDGLIDAQRNLLTMQAFSRFVGVVTLSTFLIGCGLVVGVILRNEVLGRPTDRPVVKRRRRVLAGATVAAVLPAPVLASRLVTNYASALDHRTQQVTIEGAQLNGDELQLRISVPNALTAELFVESVLVYVTGGRERLSSSEFPEATVPRESRSEITVDVGSVADALAEDPNELHIDGYVRVSAFTGFEERMRIQAYELSIENE